MGSLALETDDSKKEIHVLVTGFGPFFDNTTNPSFLIASSLPPRLILPNLPPIHIHCHPTPIEVAYDTVLDLIPRLLFSKDVSHKPDHSEPTLRSYPPTPTPAAAKQVPNYDITLNIGLAPGRKFYTLETQAHRSGYFKRDIHNHIPPSSSFPPSSPLILNPSFDLDDVWRRWVSSLLGEGKVDVDVRPSDDPGRYLCDFTFYTCLVEYWKRGLERPCLFLHVPQGEGEDDVERGRSVVLGLVGGVVGSEIARGRWGKGA